VRVFGELAHADIESFLELRDNTGDGGQAAPHHLKPGELDSGFVS